MSLNPQVQSMLDSNPQLREMMQNPDFLRQFSSPEMMQVSWVSVVSMHVNYDHVVSPLSNDEVSSYPNVMDCFFFCLQQMMTLQQSLFSQNRNTTTQ